MARAPKKKSSSRALSRGKSATRRPVAAAKKPAKKSKPSVKAPAKKKAIAKPKITAKKIVKPAPRKPLKVPPKSLKAAVAAKSGAKSAAKASDGPQGKRVIGRPFPKKADIPVPAIEAPKPAPKPVVQKPPPPPPEPPKPKKPQKPELTPREIEKIRVSLTEQRAVFAREFSEIEESAFNLSQSETSGEVPSAEDPADAGSFTFEREKEHSIGQNIRDLLDKVDHALQAIAKGTYGLCENCGDPINKARLLALPYSTMCIRCKQQDERTR